MQTIAEEFEDIRRSMARSYIEARRVSFNSEGYLQMLREQSCDVVDCDQQGRTYRGLPYEVRPQQVGRVALHETAVQGDPSPVRFRVDGLNPHQSTMEVIGQALTQPQLCNIIQSYRKANPDDTFTRWLGVVVEQHGSFE